MRLKSHEVHLITDGKIEEHELGFWGCGKEEHLVFWNDNINDVKKGQIYCVGKNSLILYVSF